MSLGAEFCDAVAAALQSGDLGAIPDEELQRLVTAAVNAYAAKAEAAEAAAAAIQEKTGVSRLEFRVVRRSDKRPIPGVAVEFS